MPFHWAAPPRRVEITRTLLEHGADLLNIEGADILRLIVNMPRLRRQRMP